MRLGISISSTHLVADHAEGTRWMIERARAARDSGLDSLSLGDHHSVGVPYYQGVPMLGRILAEWDPDRPAGCLFLLPLWNPVLVAEQVGTLATMIDAPFLLQTGIGGGAGQFAAMGADLGARGVHTDEAIRVISALLAGETVSSELLGFADATVAPRPPAGVQWWIGAGAPVSLRRAGTMGDVWYAGPWVTATNAPAHLDVYRAAATDSGRVPRATIRKDVIVLSDAGRARRLGDEMIAAGYRGMPREQVAYGGVDEVVDQLAPLGELGFEEVVVRCMTLTRADALETIELCGEVRAHLV